MEQAPISAARNSAFKLARRPTRRTENQTPFPASKGAFGQPTTINNVETLAAAAPILRMGGSEYAKIGTPKNTGTRIFCVSGHVQRPGLYELPLGVPLMTLVQDLAGGTPNGKNKGDYSWRCKLRGLYGK